MDCKDVRKVAKDFMEYKRIMPYISALFETESVKEKIKEKFELYYADCEKLINEVREELDENRLLMARKIVEAYTCEFFSEDIQENFVIIQYMSLQNAFMISDDKEFHDKLINEMKKAIENKNEAALRDVYEIIDGVASMVLKKFIIALDNPSLIFAMISAEKLFLGLSNTTDETNE